MASSSTYAFFQCHYACQKFPFFCVILYIQPIKLLRQLLVKKQYEITLQSYGVQCQINLKYFDIDIIKLPWKFLAQTISHYTEIFRCRYSTKFQEHPIQILIRSNKMQHFAGIYLLQSHSTCFGCPSHPSSGIHKTVTAASGTGHSIWATTFLRRGVIRPRRRKVVAQILWPAPEAAVTVLCIPDDGCDGHPQHVEWLCSK
jgi:hypothetical protein